MRARLALVTALLALLTLPGCGRGASLSASDAWIREAPPGATALAGYVTLSNAGPAAVRCDAVNGPDFGAVELHRTVVENGVSRMLRDQAIEIAPGATAQAAPGGLHLMLFRPLRQLRAGDRTSLTLRCGEHAVRTDFEVRAAP
ncbi:MAG TPA: copper chaperone PCu(A)C [Solimonas sp.]|nr:copper chaperone PCu(A)C [Solimonas sp.]